MFESLTDRLQGIFKGLRNKGKLTEQDVNDALRQVRLALLEADVNFKVVKDLIAAIKERAIGQEVLQSLTPEQHVIKIVHEELTKLLGSTETRIQIASKPPTVIMLVGLQGSGKTTQAGKLALHLRKQGKRPLLAALDIHRPAAIKQLQVVGAGLDIPVFTLGEQQPAQIARAAVSYAESHGHDVVILDTAGRLHVDDEMMHEAKQIADAVTIHETLLVVDAMTGQDAVNIAEQFSAALPVDGFILTKLDSDTRGGAAISIRAVTGRPIKFVGIGEKMDALETFHPDRMANRILGMGDMLSLIERASQAVSKERERELEERLRSKDFNLEDYLEQLAAVKQMGPLDQVLGMIPGLSGLMSRRQVQVDENHLKRVEAIIQSMTVQERRHPHIINGSRRRRIARGSGTAVQDVNQMLNQFEQMKKMLRQFNEMESGRKRPTRLPFSF
ncbi:MAG TPA: signal recognition particle protein [Armatimonadota bacterium]|nr:signal recognition particle protein [Armatimonadota bacterium]HOJ21535.1 signal recognition particle protein [Armatimonadota bacterium]HOM82135.1 signal recognition particle protein [Armatimonadota bacterium]HPO73148.1 signal recognition particle protein [Armatimonadota bacterium]